MADDLISVDGTDRRILAALAENARISLKDLAARAELSSPSTAERVRRLEDRGVIQGSSISVNAVALGYSLQAIVRIRPLAGEHENVRKTIERCEEIVECDKVTGDDCYVARLFLRSMAHLDSVVDRLAQRAETSTSLVKSQLIARRLPPLEAFDEARKREPR